MVAAPGTGGGAKPEPKPNAADGVPKFKDVLALVERLSGPLVGLNGSNGTEHADPTDILMHAAVFRNGHRGTPVAALAASLAAQAFAQSRDAADNAGDGGGDGGEESEFPAGASVLSPRCKRCCDQAITEMLNGHFATAEGHLESIGDPASSNWAHHRLYLALCLISGSSFVRYRDSNPLL